ncbi:kinase-like protein [Martensiomyces pterosporus]|nr:kinase-like protein [Martensiomyces pterosporus]
MAEQAANDSSAERPWLAYAEPDGMMHTFETFGRSISLHAATTQLPPSTYFSAYQNASALSDAYYEEQEQEQQAGANAMLNTSEPMLYGANRAEGVGSRPISAFGSSHSGLSFYDSNRSTNSNEVEGGSLTQRSAFLSTVDPATRRKIEVAQVYFLEYYVDHLAYIANRRHRLRDFKRALLSVPTSSQEVQVSWDNHKTNETNILRRRRNRTREHEFDVLAQIGQGGFGQVFLARKRDTGEVCALKKMEKQLLVRLNEVQHILTERDILRTSQSPWLVKLLYSFQDPQYLYLAMEFVPGGDIRSLLIQNEILRHPVARFYIAESIAAVSALHSFGYFHRDLKPENFLVDATGHVKLTDFGLSYGHLSRHTLEAMREKLDRVKDQELVQHTSSEKRSFSKMSAIARLKQESSRAFSIVGSPDYMAPEILYTSLALDRRKEKGSGDGNTSDTSSVDNDGMGRRGSRRMSEYTDDSYDPLSGAHLGYDFRVDYWSLGCIMFEFYASYAPFAGPTPDDVWRNVYHWNDVLRRPDFATQEAEENLPPEAWDLITSLVCHRDIRQCSVSELAKHPYFRGMDMSNLRETLIPPFIPELQSDVDNTHFDDFSDPAAMVHYRDVNNKWKELGHIAGPQAAAAAAVDPAAFVGFTYKHNRQHRFI